MNKKSVILLSILAVAAFLLYYFVNKASSSQDVYQETTTNELTGLSSLINSGSGLWATLLTNKINSTSQQTKPESTVGTPAGTTNTTITGEPKGTGFIDNTIAFGQIW